MYFNTEEGKSKKIMNVNISIKGVIDSGFQAITDSIGGWCNSDLIIIGARPAMGKTSFMLSSALKIASSNIPAAIFSLEQTDVQLVRRIISNACKVPMDKLRNGNFSHSEWQELSEVVKNLENLPLYIDDTAGITVEDLQKKSRLLKQKYDIKIIFIDYLHLMTTESKHITRQQEVPNIIQALKQLALELNIPIVVMSQIKKWINQDQDYRPSLVEIKESLGVLEYSNVDVLCTLHRPAYYTHRHNAHYRINGKINETTELNIIKPSYDPVKIITLYFNNECCRFDSL